MYAEKLFGIQKVLALRGWVFSPVERLSNPKLWILTKKEHSSPKLRVTSILFRLNEEQNIRFNDLLCKAGLEHNRSRFIVKRIFAEEFRVVRIDPTLGRYVTRLNQFYEQIQRVGNNYNQIVRAVNTHFSHTAIPRQVLLLERRTRELKALSEQVIALSREFYELWSRG